MAGPYIYAGTDSLDSLEGKPTVDGGACVALVKKYTSCGAASAWNEGDSVKGNAMITKGTVIATFVNGKYPNQQTGNHAAFYISQDASGITVIDQWNSSGTIQKRVLRFKGKDKMGKYMTPSNNGDAFSIVK
jgi:hypothetical protein